LKKSATSAKLRKQYSTEFMRFAKKSDVTNTRKLSAGQEYEALVRADSTVRACILAMRARRQTSNKEQVRELTLIFN
jgi:hypothetical protein